MRHNKKFNHLGRKSAHRKAMLSNMASSLIIHKRINTTVAKAKALRIFVEPLITRSKEDTTHNRRVVFSVLQNKEAVSELFRDIAVKIANRPGGYTRILKIGARFGDNAEMCVIELVDYNEALLEAKESESKKAKRSRRGGKKTTAKTEDIKAVETKDNSKVTEDAPKDEVVVDENTNIEENKSEDEGSEKK
jgi:large subunit ribosomal protein L17